MTDPLLTDHRVRGRALSHVAALTARDDVLHWEQIARGFPVAGGWAHLASKACGIFRPAGVGLVGALSVRTNVPRAGRRRWYADRIDDASGVFEYAYRGENPDHTHNRWVRACFEHRLPLIYFLGVAPARYSAYTCLVVADDPQRLRFTLAPVTADDVAPNAVLRAAALRYPPVDRRYAVSVALRRVHQRRFREMVLDAYQTRCCVCRLRHRELLDAAHIIGDRQEDGEPVIQNGLALCKLHHAAFDGRLLGITPDYEVRIAPALLEERDGPLLEHGLKRLDRAELGRPADRQHWPDRDRLARRWEQLEWR